MASNSNNISTISKGRKQPSFIILSQNDQETFISVANILLRFANNILKAPGNVRYRSIKLSNELFMTKLLPVNGAVDCLFTMGFKEMDDHLHLEMLHPLEDLKSLKDALEDEVDRLTKTGQNDSNLSTSSTNSAVDCKDNNVNQQQSVVNAGVDLIPVEPVICPRNDLAYVPRLNSQHENTFYQKVFGALGTVFKYESKELQALARQCIPIERLQGKAQKDFQQQQAECGEDGKWSEKDFLLLNLLAWFKQEFFSWTNSPECSNCGAETKFHSSDYPNAEERKWGCNNVECHQCHSCYTITRFPRYNHPQKLLLTRTGRCGEWANCFTLCCRTVGFEARYVLDWTDHVWTEVFSEHLGKWLHCDSCENACDKPLLYEQGWGKKLTYVIGISKDELVDVTWRYTAREKETFHTCLREEVVVRRTLVSDSWLSNFCVKATSELQQKMNDERKMFVKKRDITEIVESLSPRDATTNEGEGRVSGNLAWREARGEMGDNKKSHVFKAEKENIKSKRIRIRYFPATDSYSTDLGEELNDEKRISGWENGVELSENIFKKIEQDWQMVYLARCEGTPAGTIKWAIDVGDTDLVISEVHLTVKSQLYESGEIELKLFSENKEMDVLNTLSVFPDAFAGSKTLRLQACLKGSEGSVAWQHAQLFRCETSNSDFVGLEFKITLVNKNN